MQHIPYLQPSRYLSPPPPFQLSFQTILFNFAHSLILFTAGTPIRHLRSNQSTPSIPPRHHRYAPASTGHKPLITHTHRNRKNPTHRIVESPPLHTQNKTPSFLTAPQSIPLPDISDCCKRSCQPIIHKNNNNNNRITHAHDQQNSHLAQFHKFTHLPPLHIFHNLLLPFQRRLLPSIRIPISFR